MICLAHKIPDTPSAPGKVSGYSLPRPALTYDCGHKRPLAFRRVGSIVRFERPLCAVLADVGRSVVSPAV